MKPVSIDCEDFGPFAAVHTVSNLRTSCEHPEAPALNEGWDLTEEIPGVVATRGAEAILVPWPRIRVVRYAPEPLKPKAAVK